jgi:hypothetical protein
VEQRSLLFRCAAHRLDSPHFRSAPEFRIGRHKTIPRSKQSSARRRSQARPRGRCSPRTEIQLRVCMVRRPLYHTRMLDEYGAFGGMRIGRGNRSAERKPTPAPLSPPHIPHHLNWDRVRTVAVGSRRLTA